LVWGGGIDCITTLWRLEMAVQNKKRKRDIEKNYVSSQKIGEGNEIEKILCGKKITR
jgi:hypothetical protein